MRPPANGHVGFAGRSGRLPAPRPWPLILLWSLILGPWAFAQAPTAAQLDFFEKRIRPILVDNCYKCHSTSGGKTRGGLSVESRQLLLKGGDTGPALVPGDPNASLMIKAMRYTDRNLQMPPDDSKLPDYVVRDFEQWARMGAPDPRETGKKALVELKSPREHWSFQPVFQPILPAFPKEWTPQVQNDVDKFVFAKLAEKGLSPSPKADKITLLRRATFNLTGLPPTVEEVDAFVADPSPTAFAQVIDRLLESPQYGERWARYWLDVARYGDTTGGNNRRNTEFFHSYTYRDWVVRAFNDDMPYPQFIKYQLAADRLTDENSRGHLAAMGFLTLGNRFNNQNDDIIDDRIDVVTKGLLGLTVSCARCHDHKFDPIPTMDYYSLHGIFNSSTEPRDAPMLPVNTNTPAYREFQTRLAAAKAEVENFERNLQLRLRQGALTQTADYLMAVHEFNQPTNSQAFREFITERELSPEIAGLWKTALEKFEQERDPVFLPFVTLAKVPVSRFRAEAIRLVREWKTPAEGRPVINPRVLRQFVTAPYSLGQVATNYASLLLAADQEWQREQVSWHKRAQAMSSPPPQPTELRDPDLEQVRRVVYDPKSPAYLMDQKRWEQMAEALLRRNRDLRNERARLVQEVRDVEVSDPGAPARAVILVDNGRGGDSPVFIKGNRRERGQIAPRRFLEILSPKDARPRFTDGSGRLELAEAIATPDNPLTARVMVNRVWLHQFGQGLVRSPNDFGTRCEGPSHPALLDYLAWHFMEHGWSVKRLQKLLMMSYTWQQSSDEDARKSQLDPDNLWLWQQNRRRLDFESLRDTILHIGGTLDLTMYGAPVRLDRTPYPTRRSIYGLIDRQNLPDMLRAFDFPDPDATSGRRDFTIVPQQALFLMNSPLVINQAINTVQRGDLKALPTDGERVQMLHRLIYSRLPNETEMRLALLYLATEWNAPKGPVAGAPPWEYGVGSLTREGRVGQFFPILYNTRDRVWQAGARLPDRRFGRAFLSANGGHAPPGNAQMIVRRWTAPDDLLVSIEGTLEHTGNSADGVRGRVIYSGFGTVGTYSVTRTQLATTIPRLRVTAGETVDFVIDCVQNDAGDTFNWAPVIRKLDDKQNPPVATGQAWDARAQFAGPGSVRRLYPWEKFAQVLLETNELTFID